NTTANKRSSARTSIRHNCRSACFQTRKALGASTHWTRYVRYRGIAGNRARRAASLRLTFLWWQLGEPAATTWLYRSVDDFGSHRVRLLLRGKSSSRGSQCCGRARATRRPTTAEILAIAVGMLVLS